MTARKWIEATVVGAFVAFIVAFNWLATGRDNHRATRSHGNSTDPYSLADSAVRHGARFAVTQSSGQERWSADTIRAVTDSLPYTDSIPAKWGRVIGTVITGTDPVPDNQLLLEDTNGVIRSVPIPFGYVTARHGVFDVYVKIKRTP